MPRSVFSALSKYAVYETENYLTESFVFLLQSLVASDPKAATPILEGLLGIPLTSVPHAPASLEFSTQLSLAEGIPDMAISAGDELRAFVEVKNDAPLGTDQLESYLSALDASPQPLKSLVLLTRSRAASQQTTLREDQYHHVCWYEVHSWLRRGPFSDPVVKHLCHDFARFLEEKHMSLNRVIWQYEDGVRSLLDFTTMLEAAVGQALPHSKSQKTAGWSWRGFYLDGRLFTGVYFDAPTTLILVDNMGKNPTHTESLSLLDTHFFALEAGEQFELLIRFLKEAASKFPSENSA